ncbi:hypothetical protein AC249_AIPGENE11159 [Exaiptasia diaphana]|nr:hypothetical protein AC249_AIPGENE11159 [Exaiptasia diaphana]
MSVPLNPYPGALDNLRQAEQNDQQAANAAGQQQADPIAVVQQQAAPNAAGQQQQAAQTAVGQQQAAPNAAPNAAKDDQQQANEFVSDNGAHYNSKEFEMFANEYHFQHSTTSPHYRRSNGFIESQVKSTKTTLIKSKQTNTDPNIALLCLRTTPIDNKLPSPAELDESYKTTQEIYLEVPTATRLQERQELQKAYHDRTAKDLQALPAGASVSIRNQVTKKWEPGLVKEKINTLPRSYFVNTDQGSQFRRNRMHIRPVTEPLTDTSQPDPPQPQDSQPERTPTPQGATVTRSGRNVKPPDRYE